MENDEKKTEKTKDKILHDTGEKSKKKEFNIPTENLDNNIAEELKETRAEWKETKIDLKNAKEIFASLDNALHGAVKAGADKETLNGMFEQWKSYGEKVNELEKALHQLDKDGERPDPFQKFVKKSKENLLKGVKLLGGKVQAMTAKFLHDKDRNPKTLTAAILAEHNKVDSVYHEEQEKAAKELTEDLDKTLLSDTAKIDRWIDAIEASEKQEKKSESKNSEIESKTSQAIDSAEKKAQLLKESLNKKFNAKETKLKSGEYTRSERVKGGFQTILDVAKGNPLKDYFGVPKTPAEITEAIEKAKVNLKLKEDIIDKTTSLKVKFLKVWATAQQKTEAFMSKVAKQRVQDTEKMLETIKSSRAKNILEEIKKATDKGKSAGEARAEVAKDIENKNKDNGPGDR